MFWEVAALLLEIIQLTAYVSALGDYKEKMEEFADWLETSAEANEVHYDHFREYDPTFNGYYADINKDAYTECQSNVNRAKGAGYHQFGKRLRGSMRGIRGYSRLARVGIVGLAVDSALSQAAVSRAMTQIDERKRVDEHVLLRWSAIVRGPVGVEGYHSAAGDVIIRSTMKGLTDAGRGINSAGSAMGSTMFHIGQRFDNMLKA